MNVVLAPDGRAGNGGRVELMADDGVRLNVRVIGDTPPALFLLHGFGDGGFVWKPFMRALRALGADVSAIAPDMRGHGDSEWDLSGRYDIDRHIADACTVLDRMGMHSPILVGHSFGADIVAAVAAEYPTRFETLVIVDPWAGARPESAEIVVRQFKSQRFAYESTADYADTVCGRLPLADPRTIAEFASSALIRDAMGMMRLKCDPSMQLHLRRRGEASLREALHKVRCPILLVRGSASAIFSHRSATLLEHDIGAARLHTVTRAGHAVLLENPSGLAQCVMPLITAAGSEASGAR